MNEKFAMTCVACLAILISGYIGYAVLTARKYIFRSKIKKLMIYPIKSLPGIEVDQIEFEGSLLKYKNFYDRSWILINEDDNRMITLRSEPLLSKIQVSLLEKDIILEVDGMSSLKIPSDQSLEKGDLIHTVNIWNEEIDGQDCGFDVNDWFSNYLSKKVKLLKHHAGLGYRKSKKLVNGNLIKTNESNQLISYSDGAPLLIMNYKSVEDLNNRIKIEHEDENPTYISADRFRPNIYFESEKPYEEDQWRYMKIGNLEFKFLVECGRCKLTTLNINTLEYEKEPLETLKKYRMGPKHIFEGAPKLGVYFKPLRTGRIKIGDDIAASF